MIKPRLWSVDHHQGKFFPDLPKPLIHSFRSVPVWGSGIGRASCTRRHETLVRPEGEGPFGAGGSEEQEDLQRDSERGLLVRPQQRSQADRRTVRGLFDVTYVRHRELATWDQQSVRRQPRTVAVAFIWLNSFYSVSISHPNRFQTSKCHNFTFQFSLYLQSLLNIFFYHF